MRLAELLRVRASRSGRAHRRPFPRHHAHRGALRELWISPRPCFRRRLRHADGRPILHELRLAQFHGSRVVTVPEGPVSDRPVSDSPVSGVLKAVANRRSHSKVTAEAPTRAELLPLVAAAARAADHAGLRPWRLVELRGDARERLGDALVTASACT